MEAPVTNESDANNRQHRHDVSGCGSGDSGHEPIVVERRGFKVSEFQGFKDMGGSKHLRAAETLKF
jgi:hypothetical protein